MGCIAIIDYGVGNLKSVSNALRYLGCESVITADPQELERADGVILPGVGAFPDAAEGACGEAGGLGGQAPRRRTGPDGHNAGAKEARFGHLSGNAASAGAGGGGPSLSRPECGPGGMRQNPHPGKAAPYWVEYPDLFP